MQYRIHIEERVCVSFRHSVYLSEVDAKAIFIERFPHHDNRARSRTSRGLDYTRLQHLTHL